MKIAIYGKTFNQGFRPYITELLNVLDEHDAQLVVYKPFLDFICCETCQDYIRYQDTNYEYRLEEG